ncbi:AMP-binding protein [Candidatus Marinamargulisbacteria bacterium]|nr:AMP-binding protein [Candidatus Marinamargulisbacteria bacterium]
MIACPVYFWAQLTPTNLAIETKTARITYAELHQRVQKTTPEARLVCTDPLASIIQLVAAFRAGYCVQLLDPQSRRSVPHIPAHWHSKTTPSNTWAITAPSTVIYTSGSSATPKGVVHSFEQHIWAALGAIQANHFLNTDAWLLNLPLHHVSGLGIVFRCLLRGARLVIAETARDFLADVHRVTHVSVVRPQLQRMIEHGGDYTHLKYVLLGGSGCPDTVIEDARACGIPVAVSYGLTEMGGQVATSVGNARTGTVLPYRTVYTNDGQIYVSGRCRCLGYWTAAGIVLQTHAEGGLATRDLGVLHEEQLSVTGRLDAMFISGGENIQPEAIESVLLSHPTIQACCVVPKPCAQYGHRPIAFIDPVAPDIKAWAIQHLHPYQRPIAYYPWPRDCSFNKPNRGDLVRRIPDVA